MSSSAVGLSHGLHVHHDVGAHFGEAGETSAGSLSGLVRGAHLVGVTALLLGSAGLEGLLGSQEGVIEGFSLILLVFDCIHECFGVLHVKVGDAPVEDLARLLEAVLVGVGPDQHDYELVALLLVHVQTAQARACVGRVACLHSMVAAGWVLEQDVGVVPTLAGKHTPVYLGSGGIPVVDYFALVMNFVDDFGKQRILEGCEGETGHVLSRRPVGFVGEPMRV